MRTTRWTCRTPRRRAPMRWTWRVGWVRVWCTCTYATAAGCRPTNIWRRAGVTNRWSRCARCWPAATSPAMLCWRSLRPERVRPMSARPCWPIRCNSPVRTCCADARRKSRKFMTALFSHAMALREVDPGVFAGELNKHWTIGPKVHGGAMLALCANAARTAGGGGPAEGPQPVSVSASFLWAPDPGPMLLTTLIRKRGRRISVVDVELTQGDRTAVHAVVNLGEPEHGTVPLLSANP